MNLPNQLSLLRIFLTPFFILLLFIDTGLSRLGAFIVFTLASLTDWYDGYTARKFGYISTWGKFLDPLADKVLVSSGLICFSILKYIPVWMVIVIVVRDFLVTGLRSYAIFKKKPIETNKFAKAKTFTQFLTLYFIFLFHLFVRGGVQDNKVIVFIREINLISLLMYVVILLTVISGIIYLIGNRSHLRQMGGDIYRIFVPSDI